MHGTGGQTRAFIHIRDTVRCIEIAINNPPATGERVSVFNQTTEVHKVRDLAALVSKLTGAAVVMLPNPRQEAAENDLVVRNDRFLALGLNPTTLSEGLLEEVRLIASKYRDRVDPSKIVCPLGVAQGHGRGARPPGERPPDGRRPAPHEVPPAIEASPAADSRGETTAPVKGACCRGPRTAAGPGSGAVVVGRRMSPV